jgi:hypothetical protein
MPSLIGNYIAGNYLLSDPTTQLGTRVLKPLAVFVTGIGTNPANADSLFTRTVRALQQNVELYAVFNPSGDWLTVLVASDTTPQDNTTDEANNNRNAYLEDALLEAGISGSEVWNATINGNSISYND